MTKQNLQWLFLNPENVDQAQLERQRNLVNRFSQICEVTYNPQGGQAAGQKDRGNVLELIGRMTEQGGTQSKQSLNIEAVRGADIRVRDFTDVQTVECRDNAMTIALRDGTGYNIRFRSDEHAHAGSRQ